MSEQPTLEAAPSTPPIATGEAAPATAAPPVVPPGRKSQRGLVKIGMLVLFVGTCAFATWYWGFREREPADDLGRFQGEWKLSLGADPDPEGGVGAVAVRITGDRWQYVVPGGEGRSLQIALREETSPKEIELTFLERDGKPVESFSSHGIYEIDRKTARVLVVPRNQRRPTDLNAADAVVWVLSRVKLDRNADRSR